MDGRNIVASPCVDLPELSLVGKTEIQKALPALDIPFEPGCLNIYFGYKGSKQMQCQDKIYTLAGGEFFITPPGVNHSTGPMPISKCAHYWLRIDLRRTSKPFLGDAGLESLREQWWHCGVCHGRFSESLMVTLRTIYDLALQKSTPVRDIELRLQLSLFLLKLSESQNVNSQKNPPLLGKVKDYLRSHLGEDLSVQDMANLIGCSTTNLTTLFTKHEGISPAEFFSRLKMEEATRLLEHSTYNLRQISEQLGFANERYFSTVFKKYFLVPPGSFRKTSR